MVADRAANAGWDDWQADGRASLLTVSFLRLWNSHNSDILVFVFVFFVIFEAFNLLWKNRLSFICWDLKIGLPVYRTSVRKVGRFKGTELIIAANISFIACSFSFETSKQEQKDIKARCCKLYIEVPLNWEIFLYTSLARDTNVQMKPDHISLSVLDSTCTYMHMHVYNRWTCESYAGFNPMEKHYSPKLMVLSQLHCSPSALNIS